MHVQHPQDLLATDGITTLAVLGFTLPAVGLVLAFGVVVVRDRRRIRREARALRPPR